MTHSNEDLDMDTLIDRACDTAEEYWDQEAESPEELSPAFAQPASDADLMRLILNDARYRRANSQPVSLEEYLRLFPQLGSVESLPQDFIDAVNAGTDAAANGTTSVRQSDLPGQNPDDAPTFDSPGGDGQNKADAGHADDQVVDRFASTVIESKPPTMIGRFAVVKLLGRGGFGEVYQCHDRPLKRDVAIKLPRIAGNQTPSAQQIEAYRAEAEILAGLKHPAIVPVLELGSTDEFPCFIVMEMIHGSDLRSWMKRQPGRRVPPEQAVAIVSRMADALNYAHANHLTHRDMKPANILMDTNENPFLSDFGIALKDEDLGKGSNYVGTPTYMSPEQIQGKSEQVEGRSDIFSLGIILYELLAGQRPFRADNDSALQEQIVHLDPKPIRQFDHTIPETLEAVCRKALAKKPSDRYATALDFADALRDALAIPSPPPLPEPRLKAWNVSLAAALVLIVLAIVFRPGGPANSLVTAKHESATDIGDTTNSKMLSGIPTSESDLLNDPISILEEFSIGTSRDRARFSPLTLNSALLNGDHVRFRIRLREPAWVRLLWIDAAGIPVELYPNDPEAGHRGDERVTLIESPVQLDRGWPVEGDPGVEIAVLLVSREPLDALSMDLLHTIVPPGSKTPEVGRFLITRLPQPLWPTDSKATESQLASNEPSVPLSDRSHGSRTRSLGNSSKQVNDAVMQLLEKLRRHADVAEVITIPHRSSE